MRWTGANTAQQPQLFGVATGEEGTGAGRRSANSGHGQRLTKRQVGHQIEPEDGGITIPRIAVAARTDVEQHNTALHSVHQA